MRLLFLIVTLLAASSASAIPLCTPGSLSNYLGLGPTGCTIGNTLYTDFGLLPSPPGATQVLPANIGITPLSTPGHTGFEFGLNLNAGSGELLEFLLAFNVSGAAIARNTISLTGATAAGDGAVTLVEDKCLGGTFNPGSFIGCSGIPATLIAFAIEVDAELLQQLVFAPTGLIGVVADIAVDGGPNGTASLTSASVMFQAQTVPEPGTLLLIGGVLIGIGLSRGLRSVRP